MNSYFTNAIDRERERREMMRELAADDAHWQENSKPGSFGCHELLDRTALASTLVEQHILAHAACVQNPEWYELADQAATALAELYQRIGAEHLADDAVTP